MIIVSPPGCFVLSSCYSPAASTESTDAVRFFELLRRAGRPRPMHLHPRTLRPMRHDEGFRKDLDLYMQLVSAEAGSIQTNPRRRTTRQAPFDSDLHRWRGRASMVRCDALSVWMWRNPVHELAKALATSLDGGVPRRRHDFAIAISLATSRLWQSLFLPQKPGHLVSNR